METADFDVASFDNRHQTAEDRKLLVKFYTKARPDKEGSLAEGRPIFKDVEYIDIKIPGDRTGGVARPASHADKQRFPEHYAAFKQRIELPLEGTPLIEWPLITRSLAEELAFHNVKTVEHLSTMSDVHSGKFMGLNALKAKALTWLEQAGEEAKAHKLQEELLERDKRIALQDGQIEQLQKQMLELMGDKKPTPVAPAPLLTSALDEPVAAEPEAAAPVKKTRRRRKAATDGTIQDDK